MEDAIQREIYETSSRIMGSHSTSKGTVTDKSSKSACTSASALQDGLDPPLVAACFYALDTHIGMIKENKLSQYAHD